MSGQDDHPELSVAPDPDEDENVIQLGAEPRTSKRARAIVGCWLQSLSGAQREVLSHNDCNALAQMVERAIDTPPGEAMGVGFQVWPELPISLSMEDI